MLKYHKIQQTSTEAEVRRVNNNNLFSSLLSRTTVVSWYHSLTHSLTHSIFVGIIQYLYFKIGSICLCYAISDHRYFLVPCNKRKHTGHAHQQAASQATTDSACRHPVWLPHSSLGFQRPVRRRSYHSKPHLWTLTCMCSITQTDACGLSLINFLHSLRSITSSLFSCQVWESFLQPHCSCKFSLV